MENVKYMLFWIISIYVFELGLGYLISLVWCEKLSSVTHNAMLLSFGVLIGVIWFRIKNK